MRNRASFHFCIGGQTREPLKALESETSRPGIPFPWAGNVEIGLIFLGGILLNFFSNISETSLENYFLRYRRLLAGNCAMREEIWLVTMAPTSPSSSPHSKIRLELPFLQNDIRDVGSTADFLTFCWFCWLCWFCWFCWFWWFCCFWWFCWFCWFCRFCWFCWFCWLFWFG